MAAAMRRSLLRRVIRLVGRVVVVLLALLVLSVLITLVVVHTDWGRDQVREAAEDAMEDKLVGEVHIGRLEGSVLGDVVLRDVVIHDADGEPAITIDTLTLEYGLLPLLDGEIHLDHAVAEGVVVIAHQQPDGELNLARLVVPSDQPLAWDVVLSAFEIRGGRLELYRGADVQHFDDLHVDGSFEMSAGGLRGLGAITGTWRERGLAVEVDAAVALHDGVVELATVDAAVGELAFHGRDLRIAGMVVTSGDLAIVAPALALSEVLGETPLRGDVVLGLHAEAGAAPNSTDLSVIGAVSGAPIGGTLTVIADQRRVHGRIGVHRLDAAALVIGGPDSRLDAAIVVDLAAVRGGGGRMTARGRIDVDGGGQLLGIQTHRVVARAEVADARTLVRLDATGDGDAHATVDAALTLGPGGVLSIEHAHVVASIGDLRQASAGRAPVGGAFQADLIASGTVGATARDLAVVGRIDGQHVVMPGRRARSMRIDVDATGLPARPAGHARADLGGIVINRQPVGRVTIDARSRPDRKIAVVARSWPAFAPWRLDATAVVEVDDVVTVSLGKHHLRTNGVDWIGEGGRIAIGPKRLVVAGLRTTVGGGGGIAVDGSYHHSGRRTGDLSAAVALDGLDLAELHRSLDLGAGATLLDDVRIGGRRAALRGVVDATAKVERRGRRWSGSASGKALGLALGAGVAPVDVATRAVVRSGRVELDAELSGERLGALTVELDVDAPRRLEDLAAWQRLRVADVRRGHVTMTRLDLALAARMVGADLAATGLVDGELQLDAADTVGTITVRGAVIPGLAQPLDADLGIARAGPGVVSASIDARSEAFGAVHADAIVEVPDRPFDLAAWAGLDLGALRGASIRADDLAIDGALARAAGLDGSWQGRASVKVEVGAAAATATATIDVLGVHGGPLLRRIDAHVELAADRDRLTASIGAGIGGAWLLLAEGEVPIGLGAAWDGGVAAIRAAPLTATVTLERAPVRALLRLIGREDVTGGTVSAEISVGGTVGAPTGNGEIVLAGLGTGPSKLRELRIEADYDGRRFEVDARGSQLDRGSVRVIARADRDDLAGGSAEIVASGFELGPLILLGPEAVRGIGGRLDAAVTLTGLDPATARIEGELRLRDGRLPLGPRVGTMRKAKVLLTLADRRFTVTADGRIGDGAVDLHATGRLAGLIPRTASAELDIDGVSLIGELQPRIDGHVSAALRRDGDLTKIDVLVDKATLVVPPGIGRDLHEPGPPPDMVFIENGRPPPGRLTPPSRRLVFGGRPIHPDLIVSVRIKSALVDSEAFRGRIQGRLTATIGEGAIALDGTIEAAQGDVELFDRRYRVDRAALRFDGTADPNIDVRLIHEFSDLAMTVGVSGRLSDPVLTLTSDPASYSEGQLLSYLLGGTPNSGPGGMRDVASGIAASVLSRKLSNYVGGYLPVDLDVLRFEAATSTSAASVTAGKWLTRTLFVAYRQRLESRPEQNAGELEVEYWLSPRVVVDGTVGDRGYNALDLVWVKRW